MCNSNRGRRGTSAPKDQRHLLLAQQGSQLSLTSFMKDLLEGSRSQQHNEFVIVDDNPKARTDVIDTMDRQRFACQAPSPASATSRKSLCRWNSGEGSPSACSRNASSGLNIPVRRGRSGETEYTSCGMEHQRAYRRGAVAAPSGLRNSTLTDSELAYRGGTSALMDVLLSLQRSGDLDTIVSSEEFSVH